MRFTFAIAIGIATLFVLADTASAAKKARKLSYEQAYARCKAQIDASFGTAIFDNLAGRKSAGQTCMAKYGHNI